MSYQKNATLLLYSPYDMQITIDVPEELKQFDQKFLEKYLGQILFELDFLKDYSESKAADDSRFFDDHL